MCCVVEIVMSVVGLITLIRGEIQLSSRLMMRGTRAYLIGGMLLSTFPLALACGVLLGVALAAQGVSPEQMPERVREFWWLDFIVVFGVMLGALVMPCFPAVRLLRLLRNGGSGASPARCLQTTSATNPSEDRRRDLASTGREQPPRVPKTRPLIGQKEVPLPVVI